MILNDKLNRAGPVVDRLNDAIRENPLAAGLIGAGVAWMLMGGKGFGAMAGAAKNAASAAGSTAATAGGAVASGMTKVGAATAAGFKGAAAKITDAASDVVGSVASLVPDLPTLNADKAVEAVADAGTTFSDRINAEAGRKYGAAIQSRLSESLEKQPLLLGAIGLAIGAGIASTFATTTVESELIGQQGTEAREKLQSLKDDVTERAKQLASALKDEAERQGLTPSAAKSAAAGIGNKVKTMAGAGRDSLVQNFASKSK